MKYPVIILDCDGVILDSNNLKSDALGETVSDYGPELAAQFVTYHKEHGGISRYQKFEYFLREMVGQYSENEYQRLLENLSNRVKSALLTVKFTNGALAFIQSNECERSLYVVSGGDQEEIRAVFQQRQIARHFSAIYGSPVSKDTHCKNIISTLDSDTPVLFVGDSRLDHEVARDNGFDFVFLSDCTDFDQWEIYCRDNKIKHFPDFAALSHEFD